jgi:hypothetical protein
MANTGEQVGVDYPTLMPDLTDIADIQQAFQMYQIGIANWNGIDAPAANSIEGHYAAVNERVDLIEGRPVGGGEVNINEPVLVGPGSLPVPNGYIWVDSNADSPTYPQFPTVLYSPTPPTGLGIGDVGTIWVDEDATASVLNVSDYQLKTQYVASAPTSPNTGQMWVDSDTDMLYFYNGTAWIRPL